ncbi:hypothetical protein H6G06_06690 [Anabaena sphaerica FACHB-251]|uniref:Uncharacterized protein n=1 Tax=Anabaena sphaerica FACHB-251 TaxID=2692883 RepID=A0A927A184_9NOST|nr:hypothetical protein [Anabaena sphaerica]MBD2293180.1 hypothetical protein [Anabaena sphaerica FACHB-251]
MGINSQITAAAILTLAIAGCTIGDTPEATQTPNPASTPQVEAQKPAEKAPFGDPVVSPKTTQALSPNNPGLIESTKGDVRADLVQKGRPDPFAEIVKPILPPMSSGMQQREVPKLPPLPIQPIQPQTGQPGQTRQRGQTGSPRQPQTNPAQVGQNGKPGSKSAILPKPKPPLTPVLPKVLPQVIAKAPIKPLLPPPPQPEAAQAVLVSGVVLIGREPQAIIRVPDEPTSRYVQAGQRLGNGVLIKRIEMNRGSEPIVIFEQYGIEVAKKVEGKPTTEPSKTAAGGLISMGTPF